MVEYNIVQCNRCLEMEFSYYDDSVHRYCKAYKAPITGMSSLAERVVGCKKYNHPKGSKKKAKYLRGVDYKRKYYNEG